MKNLSELLQKAQQMQTKLAQAEQGLEKIEVEGQSGGGMVRVTLSGKGGLVRIAIERGLLKPEEGDVLEDLIVAAHRDAKAKLETRVKGEMSKITEGLGLPPGLKLPF